MMQPAIFNRLFNKRAFGVRVLPFLFLVAFAAVPLQKAHAATFSCLNKDMRATSAVLTIAEASDTVKLSDVSFFVIQDKTNPAATTVPGAVSAGADAKQRIYEFDDLAPSASYDLAARRPSDGAVEVISDCSFSTIALSAPATTATPSPVASEISQVTTVQPQTATTTTTPTVASAGTTTGGMGLIPCDGPDCTLNSVLQLLNNLMSFFFKTLLLPLVVVMVIYLGYSYISAQGKPGQHAKLGSMAKHIVLGLLLMLCAWVIVKTILVAIGYHDDLFFF